MMFSISCGGCTRITTTVRLFSSEPKVPKFECTHFLRRGLRERARLSPKSFAFQEANTTRLLRKRRRRMHRRMHRTTTSNASNDSPIRQPDTFALACPTQRGFASEKCCTQPTTKTIIRNDRSGATPKSQQGLPTQKIALHMIDLTKNSDFVTVRRNLRHPKSDCPRSSTSLKLDLIEMGTGGLSVMQEG